MPVLLSGKGPEAPYCTMEKASLEKWAHVAYKNIEALRKIFPDHRAVCDVDFSLGQNATQTVLSMHLDADSVCDITIKHVCVLVPQTSDPQSPLGILAINAPSDPQDNPDLWLDATVQWMFEKGVRPIVQVQYCTRDDRVTSSLWSAPLVSGPSEETRQASVAVMTMWLTNLLVDMVIIKDCSHVPVMAVKKVLSQSDTLCAEAIEAVLAEPFSPYVSYLPQFKLAEARVPREGLSEIVARRLQPFVNGTIYE
jgi:hypothetical protein